MAYAITIASDEERFEGIILKLEPIIRGWPFLRDTVFVHVPVGAVIVWHGIKPTLAKREAIIIHGLNSTGGDFESTQGWRHRLREDFEKATGISTIAD